MDATEITLDRANGTPTTSATTAHSDGALGRLVNRVADKLDALPAADVGRRDQADRHQVAVDRRARLAALQTSLGPRYRYCTLDGYEIEHEGQQAVVDALRGYVAAMPDEVAAGNGIVWFGPSGTGKDHLAVATAREAILQHGIDVMWRNGLDLYGQFRDAIDSRRQTEARMIQQVTSPTILIISDPVSPAGSLTEYQSQTLLRILDKRYRACKPTWATINVADGKEADARLGVPLVDRLRDGALACKCSWPSYRRGRTVGPN